MIPKRKSLNKSVDDPLLYFGPESDATVVEFTDDRDHVSSDTVERTSNLVVRAGSEGSTIEPIALDALRDELTNTQLPLKESVAALSVLRSELDSLSALATEIAAASRRVEETARAALKRDATVEQRLDAIESRLGALGDLADVRREMETRFDALKALAHKVRAQLQQREKRDLALGREMARTRSVQAFTESAWRRVWELVERGRTALSAKVRRRSLSLLEAVRIPKTSVSITYVAVATVVAALALSTFVLHSVGRPADRVGRPVVTPAAPVPSTAVPVLPSASSATTLSGGALDSATKVRRYASARQVASAEFETPATPRRTEFVGTLSIRSAPDNAEVHIDRERVGETPLELRRLRAGSHAIWIEHEGYQRWTAGVNVPADERTQVTVTLQAEPGR
jgi:hypothetical protein